MRFAFLSLFVLACTTSRDRPRVDWSDGAVVDAGVDASIDATPAVEPLRPAPVAWPADFLGGTPTGFLADNAHVRALREASQLTFHRDPSDSARGIVTARGVTLEGEAYEHAYLARYHPLSAPDFSIERRLSRNAFDDWARIPDREAGFDYCAATLTQCLAECSREWCPSSCRADARRCLTIEDVVARDDDAVAVVHEHASEPHRWDRDEEPVRIVFELRWGSSRRTLYPDETLGRGLFEGLELSVVKLSARRSAVYLHAAKTGHNRVLIRDDETLLDLGGHMLHDYEAPLPSDGSFASHDRPWTSDEAGRIRFPGDNTLRRPFTETEYCGPSTMTDQQSSWDRHRRRTEDIIVRLNARSDAVRSVSRTTSRWGACYDELLAACPFVDLIGDAGTNRLGEILRNVRYEPETQSLALRVSAGRVVVRISEEKREVTYLDEIHALVDGRAVYPRACQQDVPPPYCEADGHSAILHTHDALTLELDLPPGPAELVATGYYVPL